MRLPIFLASILYRNSVYLVKKKGRVVEEIPFCKGKIHGIRKKYCYDEGLKKIGYVSVSTPYNMGKRDGIETRYLWDINRSFFLSEQSDYLTGELKQEIPYVNGKISGTVQVFLKNHNESFDEKQSFNLIERDTVKNGKLCGESIFVETRRTFNFPYWKVKCEYDNNRCTKYVVYIETNSIKEAWKEKKIYLESIPDKYFHTFYYDGTIKTKLNLKESLWETYYPSGAIKTKCFIKSKGKSVIERFYETGELYSRGVLYRDSPNGSKRYNVNFEHSVYAYKQENVSYFAKDGVKLESDSSDYRIEIQYYESGSIKSECPVIKGEKEGIEITYNECGFLQSETPFVNDKENGTAYTYYSAINERSLELSPYYGIIGIDLDTFLDSKYVFENGSIKYETSYNPIGFINEEIDHSFFNKTEGYGGATNGRAKAFFADGQLKAEYMWKDGKVDGMYIQYYHSGNKLREAMFKNGVREGEVTEYYNSNEPRKMIQTTYKDDLPDGEKKYYSYDGQVVLIYVYKAGQLMQIHCKVSKNDDVEMWIIADVKDGKHTMFGGRYTISKVVIKNMEGRDEKIYENPDASITAGHLFTNYAVSLKNDKEYAMHPNSLIDTDGYITLSGCYLERSQDLFERDLFK